MLKQKTYRNRKYLDWVKRQDCYLCHAPADDPHHAIGVGMSGMGTKAPDWCVVGVCRQCHTLIHNTPELWPEQWEHVAKTLGKAIEDGIL